MATERSQVRLSESPRDERQRGASTSRRRHAVGLSAALLPALLAFAGYEDLTLATAVVVSPFMLALWLRFTEPSLAVGRAMRFVAAVLLASLVLVFSAFWLPSRAHRIEPSQLLGLTMSGIVGTGVAFVGGSVGRWLAQRHHSTRAMAPHGDAVSVSEGGRCEECPVCGECFESGTGRCARDGVALSPLNVPHVLAGRYRLEHRLGRGGMATVYVALDSSLGRHVAVKLVRDDLVGLSGAAERFQREAQAAASFNHPNVVTVFDYGMSGTQAFLVMELLNGSTLRQALRVEERIEPRRALAILRDVAAAVEAAHGQGIVHRDLKPENICLVSHGSGESAKVLDFGLAKILTQTDRASLVGHVTGGGVIGTPLYMAPEQIRGEEPHPSWDVWAVAVIAFEMLCGSHPFAAMTLAMDVGPGESAADAPSARLPREGQLFFAHALAIDRDRRPGTVRQFVAELERSLHA